MRRTRIPGRLRNMRRRSPFLILAVVALAAGTTMAGTVGASPANPNTATQTACSAPAWTGSAIYNVGDTVSHNGHEWRANHWLWPGLEPGVAGSPPFWVPWTDLGPCGSTSTTSTTSTTTSSSTTSSTSSTSTTSTTVPGPASQPGQPTSGPGGSDYPHDDWTITEGGSGNDAWFVFQPTGPRPASAPVSIVMHGYDEYSGFNSEHEFIRHMVRNGNVVIYPRWQTSLFSPCLGPFNIEPCMTSALNGINGGLNYLQADPANRVQPELHKASYFGFSFGGIITANLANRHASLGIPEPKVIFMDDLHDGALAGAGEPALDDSMAGIPSSTLVQCHTGAFNVESNQSCNAWFPMLDHIPAANKDLVLTYDDTHGDPDLSSEHGVCNAGEGGADAYDYYFCWKVWDSLQSQAFEGTGGEYALGDTPEHRFNGLWSDGTPITELKIQDTAPITP